LKLQGKIMAKVSPKKLAEIQGMLVAGLEPTLIADRVKVNRATVYEVKKAMDADIMERDISTLSREASPAIVNEIAKKVRDQGPMAFEGEVNKVINGIESLQKLETRFHDSFTKLLDKADDIMDRENITVSEWQTVTSTLASAFKDVFNSKGTTINVANADNINGQQSNSLTMFQSRMRH
jgi:hypothetical protein